MARPAKPKRAPAWDEQLVPIDGQRLKGLIDDSKEWTIPTLSEEMRKRGINGASRSTIDYICRERNQTCRAPLRKELAKEFDVPEKWLSGEMKRLPFARPRKVWSLAGRDWAEIEGMTIAEIIKAKHAGAKLEIIDYPADLEHPPPQQIARHRFMAAAYERATRDEDRVSRQIHEAKSEAAYKEALNAHTRENRHKQLSLATLGMATSPVIWQALLDGHHDIDADTRAEAEIALMKAFTVILGPWMRGDADLDREILRDVNKLFEQLANSWMNKALAAQRERFQRGKKAK